MEPVRGRPLSGISRLGSPESCAVEAELFDRLVPLLRPGMRLGSRNPYLLELQAYSQGVLLRSVEERPQRFVEYSTKDFAEFRRRNTLEVIVSGFADALAEVREAVLGELEPAKWRVLGLEWDQLQTQAQRAFSFESLDGCMGAARRSGAGGEEALHRVGDALDYARQRITEALAFAITQLPPTAPFDDPQASPSLSPTLAALVPGAPHLPWYPRYLPPSWRITTSQGTGLG